MKAEYVREIKGSYMRIEGEDDGHLMKMVTANVIPGFLHTTIRSVNNQSVYMYDVSSKMRITDVYERKEISGADMRTLGIAVNRLLDSVDEYLLNIDSVILNPEQVFIDNNTGEWYFAYCSDNSSDFMSGMRELFEYIIQRVCHTDNEAVTMAYGIYKKITIGTCSPDQLFEVEYHQKPEYEVVEEHHVIDDIIPQTEIVQQEKPDRPKLYAVYGIGIAALTVVLIMVACAVVSVVNRNGRGLGIYLLVAAVSVIILYYGYKWYKDNREAFYKMKKETIHIPYEKDNIVIRFPEKQKNTEAVIPETTNNATVLLTDIQESGVHRLKWEEQGCSREYELTDSAAIIGSAAERSDCVINLPGISRLHARITFDGSSYYIKDMNSTNGTFVNDKELACFEIQEIRPEDRIKLGKVELVFI